MIALLAEHPAYEAVEAFSTRRRGAEPLVRAIVTRRDHGQTDYVNDRAAVADQRAGPRAVHFAPIVFETGGRRDTLRVGLGFATADGTRIVLELRTAGPPLPAFGGLTDPLGHAPDVLPIMYRDASAAAAPGTRLTIGREPCALAAAYYTEGFAIGVLTTGVADLRLVERPAQLGVGARWVYAREGGELVYDVAACDGDRLVIVRRSGRAERIAACLLAGRVHIVELRVPSASEMPGELVLSFDPFLPGAGGPAARFAIGIDAHASLVTGRVEAAGDGFTLIPEKPAWACSRAVAIVVSSAGDTRRVSSAIVAH